MTDTQMAATYPTEEQYARWKKEADDFDMSTSEFMQAMIEAGMKKFERHVETDEDARELRQQRNDLKEELDEARDRIRSLEEQVYSGEKAAVEEFIQDNPGADWGDISRHIADTVPVRVNRHLTELEGEEIYSEGDEFYPMEGSHEG